MWHRWLKSDIVWAAEIITKQGGVQSDDEFAFLKNDWNEKWETWMYPYVERLWKTEHITKEEAFEFNDWAYGLMEVALDAIHNMEVENNG
jgi:hypothetical protein